MRRRGSATVVHLHNPRQSFRTSIFNQRTTQKPSASGQSYLLSDLGEDASGQQFQIRSQRAGLNHLLEGSFFMGRTKEDVVLQSSVLNPGLLRYKS